MAHNRDDFAAATKRQLAGRAGYRCSNPTCRRPTSRPDPANTRDSISIGVAAHISAASSGGPRFDATIDTEARRDINNGVWLCQVCAKVIDDAPAAFTADGLRAWKRHAEMAAARDASAVEDTVSGLLRDLDAAHAALIDFGERWQQGEPPHDFNRFEASVQSAISYSNTRRSAYQRDVSSMVTSVISRAEVILGARAAEVIECKREAMSGPTNYIGMRMSADSLQRLRNALSLR